MRSRTLRRAVGLAVALAVLHAVPAAAHPFFREQEAPASSLATLTLDLVHGCHVDDHAHDDAHELGAATTHVAMELPPAVSYVAPADPDGWVVEVEEDDGRAAVVTWSDAGGAQPAPRFELDLVVDGEPGDEVWFRVVQTCGESSHRWVGTPDALADEPGVRLTLTAADPSSPPPDPAADSAEPPEDPAEAPEDPAEAVEPADDDVPVTAADEQAAAALPTVLVIAVLVLAVVLGLVSWRRRRSAASP